MLHELRVENLVLMERAELRLVAGLNVLTGETGAGKTLLAQALDLLLGGRARRGIVRAGAEEAYVEGIFSAPAELPEIDLVPRGVDEVVLARRVWPDGRTRAYICGRSATLADLRQLAGALISFYGQHEHRKLMLADAQLEVLDGHCGPQQLSLVSRLRAAHARAKALERRLSELRDQAGSRERELDLVRFELEEIQSLAPSEAEEVELAAERERLQHLEMLTSAATLAAETVASEEEDGLRERLAQASHRLEAAAAVDPSLAPIAERLAAIRYEAEDLGAELRGYALGAEAAPGRLEQVQERLAGYARLERKHGGSIDQVLAHAERCRSRLAELEHAEVALEETESQLLAAVGDRDALAAQVSANRRQTAPALAEAVRASLAELAMPEAQFEIELRPLADGCAPAGAESVEFLIAPNPGLPAGPLREIASGGETSRVMLALLSSAREQPGCPSDERLLVFDEVDAGIGGHTARAVGVHLQALAGNRQVLCITHLPQVAALAGRHFTIIKDTSTTPARTTVKALDGDRVVGELVRMLGAGQDDTAASQHARALLAAA